MSRWWMLAMLVACTEEEPEERIFLDPAFSQATGEVDSADPTGFAVVRATLGMSLVDAKVGTLASVELTSATIVQPEGLSVALEGVYFEEGSVGASAGVYSLLVYGIQVKNSELQPLCASPEGLVLRVVVNRVDVPDTTNVDVPFDLNCL